MGDQLPPLPQLLVQLAVRGEEDDPGEEEALAHGHPAPLQVATQVSRLGLEEKNEGKQANVRIQLKWPVLGINLYYSCY